MKREHVFNSNWCKRKVMDSDQFKEREPAKIEFLFKKKEKEKA